MSGPSPELKQRVLAAVQNTPAPTADEHQRQAIGAIVGSTIAGLALAIAVGMALHWHGINEVKPQSPPRTITVLLESFIGSLAIAAIAVYFAAARGRSMLGRSRQVMAAAVVLAPIAVFVVKRAIGGQVPGLVTSDYGQAGLKCLSISFLTGALPLAAVLYLRRFSDPIHPRLSGAGIGLSAGMLTWLVVDLWCPVCYVPHLLLGHVLPTVTFIAVGAVAGGYFLRIRPWTPRS